MFSQNTIARIQKQSNNALQTFHKVVNDFTSNNKEISNEISNRENQKEILDQEIETLSSIKSSNDKVINKVQKFLSDED